MSVRATLNTVGAYIKNRYENIHAYTPLVSEVRGVVLITVGSGGVVLGTVLRFSEAYQNRVTHSDRDRITGKTYFDLGTYAVSLGFRQLTPLIIGGIATKCTLLVLDKLRTF